MYKSGKEWQGVPETIVYVNLFGVSQMDSLYLMVALHRKEPAINGATWSSFVKIFITVSSG